jgi:hypothetical protein
MLLRELSNMKIKKNSTLKEYFSHGLHLQSLITSADHHVSDQQLMTLLLEGLPDADYVTEKALIRANATVYMANPSVMLAYLQSREAVLTTTKASPDDDASYVFHAQADLRRDFGLPVIRKDKLFKTNPHRAYVSSDRQPYTNMGIVCYNCGKRGHPKSICPELARGPDRYHSDHGQAPASLQSSRGRSRSRSPVNRYRRDIKSPGRAYRAASRSPSRETRKKRAVSPHVAFKPGKQHDKQI